MRYDVTLLTCNGETKVVMELTTDELRTIKKLSDLTREASKSPCQPVLIAEPVETLTPES